MLSITRPYQKVTLKYLGQELSLDADEVEGLLVDMILDERISARIDQIHGYVQLGGDRESVESKKLKSLAKWADTLANSTDGMLAKLS